MKRSSRTTRKSSLAGMLVLVGILGSGCGTPSNEPEPVALASVDEQPQAAATPETAPSTTTPPPNTAPPTTAAPPPPPAPTTTVAPRPPAPPTTVAPTPTTAAAPPATAAPATTVAPAAADSAYYANCDEARAAGVAPIRQGEPGYRAGLDRDKDGIACDT